ncbi:MAG: hypothetical protein NTW16_01935 [Bacteroidetes bacterium]|nr:hypothetical protein [Bacteroidota bacterium]
MKTIQTVYFVLISAVICSCSSLSEKVDIKTIDKTVEKIKKDNPKLDSNKIYFLNRLVAISKGTESFAKFLNNPSLNEYILDKKEFDIERDNIFNYFKAEKITFKDIFDEFDLTKAIEDSIFKANYALLVEIDKFCVERQIVRDSLDAYYAGIKDSINKLLQIKLISIQSTEQDYRDVVFVKIQFINNTDKPIEAVSFSLELTDNLGNKLATLNCRSNDRIVKSNYGYWTYDKWENEMIYKNLKNMRAENVSIVQTINKLNINGVILSSEEEINSENVLSTINLSYTTPKYLRGYCSYLEENDDLYIQMSAVNADIGKEKDKRTPILIKYIELSGKVFNFDKKPSS